MPASASQVERALLCPASSLLPKNRRPPSPSAKRGTMAHALITSELRGWDPPDKGRYRIAYDLPALKSYLGEGELRCELAMGWDPFKRSTDILGENLGREYGADDGRLYGSADIVVIRPAALVVDIKTGQQRGPAASNWQLRTLAVMTACAYGVESVTGCLAHLGRDGSWTFDAWTWGAFALDALSDQLAMYCAHDKTAAELYAAGWEPAANPSPDSCRYCECECDARHSEAA